MSDPEARLYLQNLREQSERRRMQAIEAAGMYRSHIAEADGVFSHSTSMARTFAIEQDSIAASMQRRMDMCDNALSKYQELETEGAI